MAGLKWVFKDPDEVEDFVVDWTARLVPSDTIASSQWIGPDPVGINVLTDSFTNNGSYFNGTTIISNRFYTTIWLSGGTIGVKYSFTNRIMTTGGRTYDQTVSTKVKTR